MINVSDFTKELFAKWYPFDPEPTADEWQAVPQYLAPVQAIQFIKRARMVRLKEGGVVRHPSQDEVASVSVYKSSKDHEREIALHEAKEKAATIVKELYSERSSNNASPNQRRKTTAQSNGSAPRHIQRSSNGKAKRHKRK